jgi:hypothetical protein
MQEAKSMMIAQHDILVRALENLLHIKLYSGKKRVSLNKATFLYRGFKKILQNGTMSD